VNCWTTVRNGHRLRRQANRLSAARTESLGHELQDVIDEFQKLTQKELPAINAALKKKKLQSIPVMAEADWQKKKAESAVASGAGMRAREGEMREMD